MIRKTVITLALSLAPLLAACPAGGDKKPVQRPAAATKPAPPPAQPAQSEGVDWGAKIGGTGVESHSDKIGAASIDTLAMGGPDVTPKVAEFIEDPSPQVRKRALDTLAKFGKDAAPAVPRLLLTLRNVDPNIRAAGTRALAGIGAKSCAKAFESALKDKNPAVVVWAHAGLSKIAGECEAHLAEVAVLLANGSGPVAGEAADAIEWLPCPNVKATKALLDALTKDDLVRAAAVRALGSFGPKAAEAIPALISILKDKAWPVRQASLLALARMGDRAAGAVPVLAEILEDPAPKFRELAAHALEAIGPQAAQAVPALKKATLDSEPTVQAAAKRALAAIVKEIPEVETPAPAGSADKGKTP